MNSVSASVVMLLLLSINIIIAALAKVDPLTPAHVIIAATAKTHSINSHIRGVIIIHDISIHNHNNFRIYEEERVEIAF